jgi:multiple sugar transport system permease protein
MNIKKTRYSGDFHWAFLFLLPSIAGFSIFIIYPTFASLFLSFTEWDLLTPWKWTGIKNYISIFNDTTTITVLKNTVYYTLVTVPILIILPMLLAVALNQKIIAIRFFRVVYFLPVISSMIAVSMVWQWMFNKDFGIINYFLGFFNIEGPNWLTNAKWALPAVMITSIWKGIGYNMLLFLAGLQSISSVYYEAAEIEGVTISQKFRFITFPLLSPTTFFVTVMSIINSFQVFDQVVVMTGGGPSRTSSVLIHYLYQNAFKYYNMGYACALGWLLALFILVLTALQFLIKKKNQVEE